MLTHTFKGVEHAETGWDTLSSTRATLKLASKVTEEEGKSKLMMNKAAIMKQRSARSQVTLTTEALKLG